MSASDAKTIVVKLKEPTGLLIFGLGKPSSNVPFMMPKRVAETDPEHADLRLHRLRSVRVQAGRMEAGRQGRLRQVRQVQAALRAAVRPRRRQGRQGRPRRVAGDLRPSAGGERAARRRDRRHRVAAARPVAAAQGRRQHRPHNTNPLGNQYTLRPNHLQKPFDNPKVRQALLYALNQKDFLEATIGNAEYYKTCKAMFVCGTALASREGHGRPARVERQQGEGTAEGSELRRHADRAAAVDRPAGADQPRAGGEVADGEGRLQGRHAVERLAVGGRRGGSRRTRRRPAAGTRCSPRGSRPTSSIR